MSEITKEEFVAMKARAENAGFFYPWTEEMAKFHRLRVEEACRICYPDGVLIEGRADRPRLIAAYETQQRELEVLRKFVTDSAQCDCIKRCGQYPDSPDCFPEQAARVLREVARG